MHSGNQSIRPGTTPPSHIIYIAGAGRSGSTLLSNLLGQLPGAVSVGELYYLWERGLRDNILCGCGTPVRECPFWAEVLQRTSASMGVDDVAPLLAAGAAATRTRRIPWLLTARGRDHFETAVQPFSDLLEHLYRAIREITGCQWIVDASKFPTYGFVLTRTRGLDVSVIHLIRDARAVGYSWQRKKYSPDSGTLFGRMSTGRSALIWDVWNVGAEVLGGLVPAERSYRLRYESFIEQPEASLADIIRATGVNASPSDVITEGRVTMRQAHTIGGNPVRFERSMPLRLDTEWQRDMPAGRRALTTLLTWPLLWRYQYWPARSAA